MQSKSISTMLLGLFVGLIFFGFPIIGFDFSRYPGDLVDGRLNLYFLEHCFQFFSGNIESFWDAPFMYPEENVIAYSDNLLGSSPIYSFFRFLGFQNFTAYQLWYLSVASLNYISAFYLLRFLFRNNYAAIIGAFIFAFSISLESQVAHAQTFPRFAIPLAFLCATKFSEHLNPKFFFLSLLLLIYQFYCGIYLGFLLAIPLGLYLGLMLFKGITKSTKQLFSFNWYLGTLGSVAINILILLPLVTPYIDRSIEPTADHFLEIFPTIPSLKSYLFSPDGSLLWGVLSDIGKDEEGWWDHQIFTGILATISFLIGIIWLIYKPIKSTQKFNSYSNSYFLILTGVVCFFLFIRFNSITAYEFIYGLPGYSAMRSITRIINVQLIFFGICSAGLIHWITSKYKQYSIVIFLSALIIVVLDNAYATNNSSEVSNSTIRTGRIEKAFSEIPSNSVVSYEPKELNSPSKEYHLDAMLAAQKHHLIVINAYTATSPVDFDAYWYKPNEFNRNYWLGEKELDFDTLYVVNEHSEITKIPFEILSKKLPDAEEKALIKDMNYIRTDENWMKSIREKAKTKNISVDSMLYLDAVWIRDNAK